MSEIKKERERDCITLNPYSNKFTRWQLNGIVGVPLYKIYRRKKEWRSEGPITDCPVSDEQDLETVKVKKVDQYQFAYKKDQG